MLRVSCPLFSAEPSRCEIIPPRFPFSPEPKERLHILLLRYFVPDTVLVKQGLPEEVSPFLGGRKSCYDLALVPLLERFSKRLSFFFRLFFLDAS